jgi:hypothetical protein
MNQIATHNKLIENQNIQKTSSYPSTSQNGTFNHQNSNQKNQITLNNNTNEDINKNSIINQSNTILKNPNLNPNNFDLKPKIESNINKSEISKQTNPNLMNNLNSVTSKSESVLKIPEGNFNTNQISNTTSISSSIIGPSSKNNSSNKINFNIMGGNLTTTQPIGINSSVINTKKKSEIDDYVSYDTESNDSSPRSNVGNNVNTQKNLSISNIGSNNSAMQKNTNNDNQNNNTIYNFNQHVNSSMSIKLNNFNSPNTEERGN